MSTTNQTNHSNPAINGHAIHTTNGEVTMSTTNGIGHDGAAQAPTSISNPIPAPPIAIDFASILSSVAAATVALGPGSAPLTIDGRRRLLKIRPGGEAHVEAVISAVERYGLVLPGVDAAAVDRDLQLLKKLAPVAARIEVLHTRIGDVRLQAQSRVWKATTTAYRTLLSYVQQYPDLQVELAPIASFLAIRFKDAPTTLRAQERRTLAKSRATRKAKNGAAPGAPAPHAPAPSDTTSHVAPPPTPSAPPAHPAPVDPPGVTLSS